MSCAHTAAVSANRRRRRLNGLCVRCDRNTGNMSRHVHLVAAARPNFMKVAPLFQQLSASNWCQTRLIHTGQHYDFNMSASFIEGLGLPDPHHNLEVGSGSHGEQVGRVLMKYESHLLEDRPDAVVVVGDTNSTLACALAAVKVGILVAHLEAGLRSRDRTMPEEINRLVTDSISDVLRTPSRDADENLKSEGVPSAKRGLPGRRWRTNTQWGHRPSL